MAHILAVAEQSFAEAGFSGTTMERLAQAAGLPKANLHYYFGTKEQLYRGVLENILALWLDDMNAITPERPPAEALTAYIRAKLAHTRTRPHASKVFAAELLHGAPHLRRFLSFELRRRVIEKARVIRGWIDRGLMAPIDPIHLFFNIWAMTQTYADFEVQVRAVLGVNRLGDAEFAAAEKTITRLVLKGCGLHWQEGKP
ncbi:MAG: TetR/AcrR family transcriptional regulator [Acidobacteriia bacterium]|nr:TetR family transcriptional regulator C-terminal domain-containing protein [Methyloceanibacter sp.]MBX5471151.1 TetR family transcriptional regulator C-terminal domain-containing protein [Acetobacteraceae bacterium]MCL6491829.1 TetR/AcrR family transcriptional regulator [Terriglobia bacterium]